jgi:hypothetical protein
MLITFPLEASSSARSSTAGSWVARHPVLGYLVVSFAVGGAILFADPCAGFPPNWRCQPSFCKLSFPPPSR